MAPVRWSPGTMMIHSSGTSRCLQGARYRRYVQSDLEVHGGDSSRAQGEPRRPEDGEAHALRAQTVTSGHPLNEPRLTLA